MFLGVLFRVKSSLGASNLPFVVIIWTILSLRLQGKGILNHFFVENIQFFMVYGALKDHKTIPMQCSNSNFEILPCQNSFRDLFWRDSNREREGRKSREGCHVLVRYSCGDEACGIVSCEERSDLDSDSYDKWRLPGHWLYIYCIIDNSVIEARSSLMRCC
jgi:hypothetical protein